MYIIVNANNVIIGTSMKLVSTKYLNDNSLVLYEIDKNEFKSEMLGNELKYFEEEK